MSRLVTIFGGSGFVGRHLVRALALRGWRVRVAVRRPDLANFLQPLGVVGQIHAVQANINDPASVAAAVSGADAVVNLVGILAETGRQRFMPVQGHGPATIGAVCKAAGITSVVQLSAIGADINSPSDYFASKAHGEASMLQACPGAVIIRPALIFGPEDNFLNRFAALARVSPVMPVIGGDTLMQPVYVGDVAEAITAVLERGAKPGSIYELGGPQTVPFRILLDYILKETVRTRLPLNMPFWLARIMASFLQVLPGAPLTVDQVIMLETDTIVSDLAEQQKRTLAGLGVTPTAIESIAPSYLYRFREKGQFERTFTA